MEEELVTENSSNATSNTPTYDFTGLNTEQMPDTLPADFEGWDAEQMPDTLPADFSGWDKDTADTDIDLGSIIVTPTPQERAKGTDSVVGSQTISTDASQQPKTRQDLINQEFDIIKGNIESNKDILDSNKELLLVKNEQARLDKIEEAKKVEQDKKAEEEGITATSRLGVGVGEFQGQLRVNVLAPIASAIGMEDAAKEMTDAGEVQIETGKAVEKKFKEIYGDDAWNVAQTIGNLAPEVANAVLGIGKNVFQATVGAGTEYARTGSVYEAGKTGLIDLVGGKIADRIFKTGNLSKFGEDIQNLPPDKRDFVDSAIDSMEKAGIDKIDEEARREILSKIDFSKPSAEVSENLISEIKVLRDNAYSRVKDAYSTANAAVDTTIKVQIPTFGRSNALFQDIIFDKNAKDALTAINKKIAEESRSGNLDATQIEAITRSLDGYTAKGGGVRVKNIIKAELRKQQEAILPDGQKDVYNNARNLFKDYGTRFTSRIAGEGGEVGKSIEDIITTNQAYEVASDILTSGMNPNRAKALSDIGLSESSKMDAVKDVLIKGLNEKNLTENNGISTIVSRYKSSNKNAVRELLGANYSKFDSNMKALEMINNTLQDSPIDEKMTQNIINFATNASLVKVSPLYGYKGMAYEGKEIATKVAFRKSGNELKSRINKFVKTKTVANRLTKALNMIMASSASNFSEEKSDDLYPKDFIKTSRNEENPEMIAELMLAADLSNSMPESSSNRGARVAGAITQGSLPPERKTAKELMDGLKVTPRELMDGVKAKQPTEPWKKNYISLTKKMEGDTTDLAKTPIKHIVPSDRSGVTISTGLDLSQLTETELRDYGVSESNIATLKKAGAFGKNVIGNKARAVAGKLKTLKLKLSQDEQDAIKARIGTLAEDNREKLKEEVPNITSKTESVLLQAYHWGGDGYRKVLSKSQKFTIGNNTGNNKNLLSDLIKKKGKDTTDADVLGVLKEYESYWRKRGWNSNANTFKRYIEHLGGKVDTKVANTIKIKSGDTLSGIARKNKTTVAKLKKLNNLKTDTIRIGQSLKTS